MFTPKVIDISKKLQQMNQSDKSYQFASSTIKLLVMDLSGLSIDSPEAIFKIEFLNGVLRLYTSPKQNIDDLDNADDKIDLGA